MPCRYDGPDESFFKEKEELNLVTRLLCETLTFTDMLYQQSELFRTVVGLERWWEEHKEKDRLRLNREQEEKNRRKEQLKDNIKKLEQELRNL